MAAMALALVAPAFASELPSAVMGKASVALVSLATTGNPDPLQAELSGTMRATEELQKKVGNLLNLEKEEHLAPKTLITPHGETYAMVAPTITKRLLKNSKGFNRTTFGIIPLLSSGIQDFQKGPSSKAADHWAG